jgi:hypothetical protein
MNGNSPRSTEELVTRYINLFAEQASQDRSLERFMVDSVNSEITVSHSERNAFLELSRDLAVMNVDYRAIIDHSVMLENQSTRSAMQMINTMSAIIWSKMTKILQRAGYQITTDNPVYFRSHLFSIEKFGRLCITRSVMTPLLFDKWMRLHVLIKEISSRLVVLRLVLDCLGMMNIIPREPVSESQITRHFIKGNGCLAMRIEKVTTN